MNDRKTALITGSSSGIGKELAIQFAKNKIDLILVARRADLLQQLTTDIKGMYGVDVKYFQCDLTDLLSLQKLVDGLMQSGVTINYLVNNAGVGKSGAFDGMDWNEVLLIIQLNIIATTYLTKRFVEALASKTEAKILNVASTASFQPVPNLGVYAASKAYMLHFSEAIAVELRKRKISVTTLCPSETNTDFLHSSGLSNLSRIKKHNLPTAAKVAEFGYRMLMKNKRLAIFGFKNRFLLFGQRFVSRTMTLNIATDLYK